MQQIKIFKSIESEVASLEQRVNDFLRDHVGRVVQITGNIAAQSATDQNDSLGRSYTPSDVMIVILYEPKASA